MGPKRQVVGSNTCGFRFSIPCFSVSYSRRHNLSIALWLIGSCRRRSRLSRSTRSNIGNPPSIHTGNALEATFPSLRCKATNKEEARDRQSWATFASENLKRANDCSHASAALSRIHQHQHGHNYCSLFIHRIHWLILG